MDNKVDNVKTSANNKEYLAVGIIENVGPDDKIKKSESRDSAMSDDGWRKRIDRFDDDGDMPMITRKLDKTAISLIFNSSK